MKTTSREFRKAAFSAVLAATCLFAPATGFAQHDHGHGSMQGASPAYRPPQPSYRPQPNYRPQQPAYRPQPGYRPQQPTYRPGQPVYRPQPYGQPAPGFRGQQGMPAPQYGLQPAAPIERRMPQSVPQRNLPQVSAAPPLSASPNMQFKGNHLGEWMTSHSNLSPAQQHAALDHEPGFHDLPQPTQQRLHERLSQLDAMPPQERQRMLANTEVMERLSPGQRAEVRSSMLQLGALPPPQRSVVQHAFRDLRGLPPQERLNVLNSRYRDLDPQSRAALEHLMQVEPMLPPPER